MFTVARQNEHSETDNQVLYLLSRKVNQLGLPDLLRQNETYKKSAFRVTIFGSVTFFKANLNTHGSFQEKGTGTKWADEKQQYRELMQHTIGGKC